MLTVNHGWFHCIFLTWKPTISIRNLEGITKVLKLKVQLTIKTKIVCFYLHFVFPSLRLKGLTSLKYLFKRSRYQPFLLWSFGSSHHCISFTRSCLTISKYANLTKYQVGKFSFQQGIRCDIKLNKKIQRKTRLPRKRKD